MNSSNKNLEEGIASSFLPPCKILTRVSISKKRRELSEKVLSTKGLEIPNLNSINVWLGSWELSFDDISHVGLKLISSLGIFFKQVLIIIITAFG